MTAPVITYQPANTTISMPNDGFMIVGYSISSGHTSSVQWYHAEDDTAVVADAVYSGVDSDRLDFTSPDITNQNGKQFYAIVTDTIDSLTTQTNTVTLTVVQSVENRKTQIVLKHSATAGVVPTTSNLRQGELGCNVADGRLWTRDDNDNIVEVGGYYDGSTLPTTDPGVSGAFWNDAGTVKISAG